jgi:pimeloyl-ACP methyl ester carboxylesterase
MLSRFRPSYLLIPILLVPAAGCAPAPNPDIGRYEPIECPIDVPDERDVACGLISVPERHERPHGPVIKLAVAQFTSPNPEAAPDPLVLNNGGPGDSNLEGFFPVLASPLGEALLAQRDVVIIELRGLYHSKPNLVCDEVFEAQLDMVGKDIKGPEANEILLGAMRRSQARFVQEGIDLPAYNHTEMAADIDLVLTKLGYDQFNLFGTSAGTMVAQDVMRSYPERLRAVVMNAAVSNGPALFEEMFLNAAASLEQYFGMCEADEACATAYPNIEARFLDMLRERNRSPIELEVVNPASGEETTLVLNGDKVSSWVFASMYWNTQIVRSLDRFTKGDFTEIQNGPNIFFPMPRFAYALGYTAVVAANPEFTAANYQRAERYRPFVDGLALFFSPRLMEGTRELWTGDRLPSEQPGPLVSDVPTLIMNGALDHVLPTENLGELVSGLSQGHAFVFEGVAHAPVDVGDCALTMLMAFLADPSGAPDASCMADYGHTFALPD